MRRVVRGQQVDAVRCAPEAAVVRRRKRAGPASHLVNVARGAIVEREVPFDLGALQTVSIALRNPDFTTARRIADAINTELDRDVAYPQDSGTVVLNVSMGGGDPAALLTNIETLPIEPDLPAKVVIDENTGVIVMGDTVRISRVAVAQGNLTIRITETPQVSQPEPFSDEGDTVVVPRTDVEVTEGGTGNIAIVGGGASLQDLVQGLNALGVGPRDMIAILQAIKAAGALQAEIEVM